MSGEPLGEATLELNADLAPLDVDLAKAKAKVGKDVAEMQAMLDSLHLELDSKIGLFAEMARGGIGTDAAAALGARAGSSGRPGDTLAAVEGVRGLAHPGSRANPLVVVMEAGRYTSLGALAAAVGENSAAAGGVPGSSSNAPPVAAATPVDSSGKPLIAPVDAHRNQARDDALALATAKLAAAMQGAPGSQTHAGAVLPGHAQQQHDAAAIAPGRGGTQTGKPIPVIISDTDQKAARSQGDAFSDALLAAIGAQAAKTRGGGGGGLPVAVGGGGGGGHDGGSLLASLLWGHGGGGGGSRPPGWLGYLLHSGMVGAGFGSLGSFAGFGSEHIVLTAGGIAGSGAAALGGGALLGAGALGKIGVGAGSDLAVQAATTASAKKLGAAYENLHTAIEVYGKGSEKAVEAQMELNKALDELGKSAGTTAEIGLAKAGKSLHEFWLQQTSGARVQASKILMQTVELGHSYVPLVAQAAAANLSIQNKALKPLFAWLKGPEGMGIFLQLESEFKSQIPTAMQALDQGVQFLGKTIAYTAPLTGGFLRDLDRFFTKWNSPGEFSIWEATMTRLITDFHVWGAFVKELGGSLVDLFDKDAHTGQTIIEVLTGMLHRVREYENSTKGSAALRNLFLVHREEVVALLKVLPPLIASFSNIYTTIAPPMVRAVTGIAEAFAKVLSTIEKAGPLGTWALGLAIIASKLKILVPLLKAAAVETGILSGAQEEAGTAAAGDAGAQAGLMASTTGSMAGAGGAKLGATAEEDSGLLGGLALGGGAKSLLLKGGLAAFLGLEGGSLVAGATGAHGTLGTAVSAAGAGAGAGFVLGPAAGALIGTEIAPGIGTALGAGIGFAAPYVVKAMTKMFSDGSETAARQASRLARSLLEPGSALLPVAANASKIEAASRGVSAARERLTEGHGKVRQGSATGRADSAGARADLLREERHLGEETAKAFIEGQQHVRFPTRSVLESSMIEQLDKLPPQARGAAARSMLAYATELEKQGRLAKGAVGSMIHGLEGQFPALGAYLRQQGLSMGQQFARSLELKEAQATFKNTLDNISQLFGTSNADTLKNASNTMGELAAVIQHSKGPLKAAAEESYGALRHAVVHQLELTKVGAGNLMEELSTRVSLGLETTAQGISRINRTLEGELGKLGAPKEIAAALVTGKESTNFKANPTPFGKAGGGLIQIGNQGDRGHDTVGLNVGGMPIAVAPGEQVAVFNRHQLPIVNAALAGMGGLPGLFSQVSTPHYMAGGGIVPSIVSAGLTDVRKAAAAKLRKVTGALPGGSIGSGAFAGVHGSGGAPSANEALGRQMMVAAGFSASEWPDLQKLWTQESGWNANSVNSSSGAYGIPQSLGHGHPYSLGDARAQIAWGLNYIKGRYGTPAAAWAHEVANNWYSGGGLLGFARGGLVRGFSSGGSVPKNAKKVPKPIQTWKVHPFGKVSPNIAGDWAGQGYYQELASLMGEYGAVGLAGEQYELANKADEFALAGRPHEGQFIVTPNTALGETGQPYVDWENVDLRRNQLEGLQGIQLGELGSLTQAWNLSVKVLESLREAVAERRAAIKRIRAKIQQNIAAIAKLRAILKRQEAELKKLPTGKHETKTSKAQKKKLESDMHSEKGTITALEAENTKLTGNAGVYTNQVTDLAKAEEVAVGDQHTIGGVSGHGGSRATVEQTIKELGRQATEIGGTALGVKLTEALASAGGGPESSTELLEREKVQLEEKLKISKQETLIGTQALSVFGGPGDIGEGAKTAWAAAATGGLFLPYGGSFKDGGIVPGPIGAPIAVVAHGGEEYMGVNGGSGPDVYFHQENHMLHPGDPATLLAVGNAAVRGIRHQGNRQSKRVRPGI